MRTLISLFLLLASIEYQLKAQPISNDTVVCFIDTAKCYVRFRINPYERETSYHWHVSIKGHYYDISLPRYKDFASIVFDYYDVRNVNRSIFKEPFQIKVLKSSLANRFIFATDEWINQQTDSEILGKKIGFYPFSKYNFIVFKHDFEKSTNDSVIMHRVQIGYNSVEE